MTWRLIGPIWRLPDVTSMERLVLLALASFTDQNGGNAYPSQSTLARMACCSRSTVKRALASLIARELIIATGKGRKGAIRYRVSMNHVEAHSEPATRPTVSHNPSKVIPGNYPGKRDSDSGHISLPSQQVVQIDRFSTLPRHIRLGSESTRARAVADANRKR
jgi:DNA-binding transcriptional MocR family regulator